MENCAFAGGEQMKKVNIAVNAALLGFVMCILGLVATETKGAMIELQNGTATFSQLINGGPYSPAQAVDGNFGDPNGWAIATSQVFDGTSEQTAVWETTADLAAGDLTFTMHFLHNNPGHLLGRFRFSVTTDDRNTFADGLHTGGDVGANWTVLSSPNVIGPAEMTFTTLGDQSVLAGGVTASTGVYTVNYSNGISGITGFRLEALEDPSLPGGNGPGLFPDNGNFLLTEIILEGTIIPIPAAVWLFCSGLIGLICVARRKKS
jgi:hypothetical protein